MTITAQFPQISHAGVNGLVVRFGDRLSAAQVAALIRQLRAQRAAALFVESLSDPRLIERIQAETGTHIGGTLYADSLTGADGEAASYLAMMTHNLEALARALRR